MEEVCSVFNRNFGLGRKKSNSTYISLKMGKFVISFKKMSEGRTGSICSTPGPCLIFLCFSLFCPHYNQHHPQAGHKVTAVSRCHFQIQPCPEKQTSFLQKMANGFLSGPCRPPFTSHWLELGEMPISKPVIDNEMESLEFTET